MKKLQKFINHLPFISIIILLNLVSAQPTFGTEGEKSRSGGGVISSTAKADKDALASFLISNTSWSSEKHLGFEANGTMVSGTTGGPTSGSTGGGSGGSGPVCLGNNSFIVIIPNNSSCIGGNGGSLTAVDTGNVAPFTYLWSTGDTTNSISGLPFGTYSVTVTDATGCTYTNSKTLLNNTHTTSSITVTACGSYSWAQNNQTYTSSGSYNDTLINNDGCDSIITLNLSIEQLPDVSILQGDSLNFCSTDSAHVNALESNGNYQWFRAQNYDWERLDTLAITTGRTNYLEIATAADGLPYAVYQDITNSNSTIVAKHDGTNWDSLGFPNSSNTHHQNIAVHPNGEPYVVYTDRSLNPNKQFVKRFDGSNWITVGSEVLNGVTEFHQLQFDASGTPYVAYTNSLALINVSRFNGTSWQTLDTVPINSSYTSDFSFAVSNSGIPYIAYIDVAASRKLVVKKYNGTSWVIVGNTFLSNARAADVSLAISSNNILYVSFIDTDERGEVAVKYFDGSQWLTVGNTSTIAGDYRGPILRINDQGIPFLFVTNSSNGNAKNALTYQNKSWKKISSLDYSGQDGADYDFEIGVNGVPYASFKTFTADGDRPIIIHYPNELLSSSETFSTNQAGNYYLNYSNSNGCSVSDTISLFDNGTTTVNQYDTANGSYTWSRTGITYDTSGIYTFTKTDTATCDSLFVLNLTVNQPTLIPNCTTSSTSKNSDVAGVAAFGQSFRATCNGTLLFLNVDIPRINSGSAPFIIDNATISIFNGNDGTGAGGLVGSALTNVVINGNSSQATVFDFSAAGVSLIEGNTYTFMIEDNGDAQQFDFGYSSTNPYSDGVLWFNPISGLSGAQSSNSDDLVFTVDIFSSLSVSTSKTDISCSGVADGSVTATASYGKSPYFYSWSSGDTLSSSGLSTISGKAGGTYTVTVTDADGATSTVSATITEPTAVNTSLISRTNVSCNGGNDGSFTAMASGGTGRITYQWSNGGTSATAFNLSAGVYSVTATDANGCTATITDTIGQPAAMNVTISAQTDVSCNGGNDGSFTAMASGGTGGITYQWSNSDTSATAFNLSAGVYTVTAMDANGCTATLSDTITQPSLLGNTIIYYTNVSCHGGADGSITFVERGGTAPYTFLWSNGDTTGTITGLTAGSYTVSVMDANNCGPSIRSRIISEPPLITGSETIVTCDSYLWAINLNVYTSTGTYKDTISASNGCDSLVTLNLTILNSTSQTFAADVCNTYDWQGMTFTQSGTYYDTILNAAGCDSLMTLNLIIRNKTFETFTVNECNSYDWQGVTYTQSGTYSDIIPNAAGCDSLMTLNLIIRNETSETFAADVCNTYDWQGMTFTQSGTYYDTIPNAAGCDSLMTLNLTIRYETSETFTADVCNSYDWQGMTFTQTGTYYDTIPNAAGCDSLMTLNLTIRYETSETFTADVCNSYDWQGMTFTNSGTYYDTIPNAAGCDSLMTLNLTIRYETSETFTADVCNSYDWQAMTFTQSGTYYDTIPNAVGCDSLMTLNLIIRNETSETFSADVCNTYDWQGMTFTQSGTYYDTIPNAVGCDSLMTLNLIIRNETSETFTADVCNSYDWQGMTFTTTGTYFDTIPNAAGCDSLMTLNLIIRNETSETFSADVCNSYDWQGMTFTQSGTYYDTIPNAAGCDSLMTLNLTIRYETSETFTADECNSYDWQGMTFTTSGTYYDTIPNAAGCDSLMILNLTIRYETSEIFTADVCNSYDWQGMTFTQSGTYYDTIPNAAGCDSLMTLNLTIRYETSETFTADVCNSYDWQGMTFTQSGIYYDTIPNASGCDSLMTLNLIIRNETSETFTAEVCNSYDWQGMTFTTSGTYYDTIPNAVGCDSLMTLNLVVNYTKRDTTVVTACDSYTWVSNGQTYSASGIYSDTLFGGAASGCDSISTLDLSIDEIVIAEAGSDQQFCEVFETTLDATSLSVGSGSWTSIAGSGNFANASDGTTNVSGMQLGTNSFEWTVVNGVCPAEIDTVHVVVNKNPIANAGPDLETRDIEPIQIQATAVDAATINWTPFFSLSDATVEKPFAKPQENTVYRLEVTSAEGCTASDEMEITVNVVMKLDATTLFSPNGDGMNDNWVVNKPELIQDCKLIIVNRNGTEVYSTNQYNNEWDGTIGGTQLPEGTYYYVFDCPDGRTLKGPITILRERR